MPARIPVQPSIPFQTFGAALGGVQFNFAFNWNGVDGAWFMDVLDEQKNPIRIGVKVVLGCLLGQRCTDPAWPLGIFQAIDTSAPIGQGVDAGLDDIGTRVIVLFFTAAEVVQLWPELASP